MEIKSKVRSARRELKQIKLREKNQVGHRQRGIMKAVLTTEDFNEFARRVDILREKNYKIDFDVDRIDQKYHVTVHGDHDIAELDRLTE